MQVPATMSRRLVDQPILQALVAEILELDKQDVDINASPAAMGLDSLAAAELCERLDKQYGIAISIPEILNFDALIEILSISQHSVISDEPSLETTNEAVIGVTQQALCFLHNIQPLSSMHHITVCFEWKKACDEQQLQSVVVQLLERHIELTATFSLDAAGQFSKQYDQLELDRYMTVHERDDRDTSLLKKDLQAMVDIPITLADGPLFRLESIPRPDQKTVFLLIAHHVIMDLWSFSILLSDFIKLMNGEALGSICGLPYSKFVEQQIQVSESRCEVSLNYWQSRLKNPPSRLSFDGQSSDHMPMTGGERYHFKFSKLLSAALRKQARAAHVSMNSLLLSLYLISLSRFSQQSDILVGLPVAGRRAPGFGHSVGCYINTLVIRADTNIAVDLIGFVKKMHGLVMNDCRHQDMPFQQIAQLLNEQSTGFTALRNLQSMFILQRAHKLSGAAALVLGLEDQDCDIHGQQLKPFNVLASDVPGDVSLMMVDVDKQLHGRFEFRPEVISSRMLDSMSDYFLCLAEKLVIEPSIALHKLDGLTGFKKVQWLADSHGQQVSYSGAADISTRIKNTINRRSEHPAIEMGEQKHTYRELNVLVEKLAMMLLEKEIGLEQRVVVLVERSPRTIIAMLSIWQIGAVYIPIDKSMPLARIEQIIDDCQPIYILASAETVEQIPDAWQGQVLRMDEPVSPVQNKKLIKRPIQGDNLAYIIYTSGSEGVPKGVMNTHAGAINFALAQADILGVDQHFRLLQLASFGFDASMSDVLMTLLTGATLVIANDAERIPGLEFNRLLNDKKIHVLTTAASLLEAIHEPDYQYLQIVISTAEACSESIVGKWGCHYDLYNGYGPTETTVGATLGRCLPMTLNDSKRGPSIGKPFNNYSVYVLDANRNPVPHGARGEIYIGGAGVARGYVDAPAKTAAVFLPDPFAIKPGQRMYRTGDYARLQFNGEFEFLGRQDQQLNIRGQRVELAEIEQALRACKGVSHVAVIEQNTKRGEPELLAFVQSVSRVELHATELKQQLAECLPNYMLPNHIEITQLPYLINGKIDRQELLHQYSQRQYVTSKKPSTNNIELEQSIRHIWTQVLGHKNFSNHDNFFDVGGHSLALAKVQAEIATDLDQTIGIEELLQYHTVNHLVTRLAVAEAIPLKVVKPLEYQSPDEPIAIIGMAGRFPDADSLDVFWDNLCAEKCSVQFYSKEQLQQAGLKTDVINDSSFIAARAPLQRPYDFDAKLFGCSAREAELLDPQRRLLLECAYTALQEAGYGEEQYRTDNSIGTYLTASRNSYYQHYIQDNQPLRQLHGDTRLSLSSDKSFVATYVAYKLALSGPAITVDTACSSSLVAVHEACKSIRTGECGLAIAGGMSIDCPTAGGHRYEPSGIGSKDGYCRAFDSAASGTVKGMGGGVVVLKRLSKAQNDGDFIHAVIHGSAVNNDAGRSAGFTAPSVAGQVAVIERAMAVANVDQGQIAFIEAHGTGTPLGDPIEVAALRQVFNTDLTHKISVGSVKANIGHLDAASGIAGLIKSSLALRFGHFPPLLHLAAPNPDLHLVGSILQLAQSGQNLHQPEKPDSQVYAGVSSFGMGGTNCHVVLGEYSSQCSTGEQLVQNPRSQLVAVSAHTETALRQTCIAIAEHMENHANVSIAELAFTVGTGWEQSAWRTSFVCDQRETLVKELRRCSITQPKQTSDRLVWVFPGQAGQPPVLARELYMHEKVFKDTLQSGINLLSDSVGKVCRHWLLGENLSPLHLVEVDATNVEYGIDTQYLQPALFCYEFALCRYLQSLGLEPTALVGHSLGEIVAATLAGSLLFEEAIGLVEARGYWMSKSQPGAMLIVPLSKQILSERLSAGLDIAVINSDNECVVSGALKAIEHFATEMASAGIETKRVKTEQAFHSSLLDKVLPAFRECVDSLTLSPPTVPWVSNVTGTWITDEQATSVDYWVDQARQPVQLNTAFKTLFEWQDTTIVIVGSGGGLQKTIQRNSLYKKHPIVNMGCHAMSKKGALDSVLEGVKSLWQQGQRLDFRQYFNTNQASINRVLLPVYQLQQQRYCLNDHDVIDDQVSEQQLLSKVDVSATLEQAANLPESPPIVDWLRATWFDLLGIEQVDADTDFFAAGADSLTMLSLCRLLEEQWALKLGPQEIATASSFEQMVQLIEINQVDQVSANVEPANTLPQEPVNSELLPLSFQQRRMWFQHFLEHDPSILNLPVCLSISGEINHSRLIQSFRVLVSRHAALRTRFVSTEGEVFQVFDRNPNAFSLPVVDVDEARVNAHLLALANRPFNIKQDWLIRAELIRLNTEHARLIIACHHIVCDGYSLALMMQDLWAIYDKQAPIQEPENNQSVADYIYHQVTQVQSGALDGQLGYWQKQLANITTTILPGQRTDVLSGNHENSQSETLGKTLTIQFKEGFSGQLSQFCRQHKLTAYVVMLATFKCMFNRYSGSTDICIGAPVSVRQNPNIANQVGLFVNTVVLRSDVSSSMTFLDICQQLQHTVYAALENAELPFDVLVEHLLPPDQQYQQNPLFRAAFVMENGQLDSHQLTHCSVAVEAIDKAHAQFDLALWLNYTEDSLSARLEYRKAYIEADVMADFAEQFGTFASQCIRRSRQSILLARQTTIPRAVETLLIGPESDWLRDEYTSLPALLHRATKQYADLDAIYFGQQKLTYREFEQRANQLAWRLNQQGIKQGECIGIYLQRSLILPVAIYAVFKCGAAIVPIDTDLPATRIKHMLVDSAAVMVLTESGLMTEVTLLDIPTLALDECDWQQQPFNDLENSVTLSDLAYIMYTSGSTGLPKGVSNSYRGLVNRLLWMNHHYNINQSDRFLHKTPIGFDVFLWELLCPLISGGSVVVIEPDDHRDPQAIATIIDQFSVSVVHFVPAMLSAYLSSPKCSQNLSLKYLFCSGEGLAKATIQRAHNHFGSDVKIINLYGPTEASIEVSKWEYKGDCDSLIAPLGLPINGVAMYVLDEQLLPVEQGVSGDLYLGGVCVALGYQNLAALTADSFIPDPFSKQLGTRMYKTGDRASMLEDRTIAFLGRDDDQLKIHGFRIELGEIEFALMQHNIVNDAVVLSQISGGSTSRLIAYVVIPQDVHSEDSVANSIRQDIRDHLAQLLPSYMLPAAIIPLQQLPVGLNGKLDRTALLAMHSQDSIEHEESLPANQFEQRLINIWEQVLGTNSIHPDSHFFMLGGSSISAIRLADRIEADTNKQCTIRLIFNQPVLSDMSLALTNAPFVDSRKCLPVWLQDSQHSAEPFTLTDLQGAYWTGRARAFEMGNVATHGYLELDVESLQIDVFCHAVNLLINQHDALRLIVDDEGKQRVLPTVPELTIDVSDLQSLTVSQQTEHIEHIRNELEYAVYNPSEWPLFEFRIAELTSLRTRVFISIDALLVDGWSIQLLERDLNITYQNLLDNPNYQAQAAPLHLRDYVQTLETLEGTELYAQARMYWQAKLPTLPATPPLPLVVDPSSIDVPVFKRLSSCLDKRCSSRLRRLASRHNASLSTVLLTAYAELLASWSNATSFSLNLTISDRVPVHPDVDYLIGNLSSLLILGVELQPESSFAENLASIQNTLIDDMQHRHYSGIQVMRQLAGMKKGTAAAQMPVVFTSMVDIQTESEGQLKVFDFSQPDYAVTQTSQAWLDCNVVWSCDELIISWDAVDSLFAEDTLQHFHQVYIDLLMQLADDQAIWDMVPPPLFSDRQPLLWQSASEVSSGLGQGRLLQDLFLQNAKQHPDRIALSTSQDQWTYQQLEQMAVNLAAELQKYSQGEQTPVAILMNNSWQQVVASLAVLLAGAPYLPIHVNSPPYRWEQLLTLGGCKLVITTPHIGIEEVERSERHFVIVDEALLERNQESVNTDISSSDLAYVMFTSGSSGTPKGVMIDHRGAVNTLLDINTRFGVKATDAVLAISDFTFDLSVYDVFGILAAGGRIVIPETDLARDPQHWLDLIQEQEVTIWNTVPALAEMLVDYAESRAEPVLAGLKLLLVSGDWIAVSLPKRVRSLSPSARFISLGGATEASIWSIFHAADELDQSLMSIPYGQALTAQSVLVLDHALRVCPIGVNGHLYIGGVGLARGYWKSQTLTETSFIQHPLTGQRLYRTGDLGRYLPSGDIEFLGRADNQVKIRGHRIELGEIEHQLSTLEQIDATAVVAHQNSERHAMLMAYVTAGKSTKESGGKGQVFAPMVGDCVYQRSDLSAAMHQEIERPRIEIELSIEQLHEQIPILNQQYECAVIDLFKQLGLIRTVDASFSVDEVLTKGAIAKRYQRWVIRALRHLESQGYLEQLDQRWYCRSKLPVDNTYDKQAIGFDLLDILSERQSSAELYVSDETISGYQTLFAQCHSTICAVLENIIAQRSSFQTLNTGLKILEVGAGHGSCTQHVLPLLPDDVSYVFSDISSFFLNAAKQNFAEFDFVQYTIFNLDEHPLLQGHAPHSYDLIIAASVLHDIQNIHAGLTALYGLLKPGGMLLMIEETRFFPFFDLGMGLQQGFDVFQDMPLRHLHPLLSREQWVVQLTEVGFCETECVNAEGTASDMIGFDVILASMPATLHVFDEVLADQYLRTRLPDYMIPSRFIQLISMPLNNNGKLDRKALPKPPDTSRAHRLDYIAPSNDQEQQLVAIWESVLGISVVGVTDNFFELGGDSLLAVQLATQIQAVFALEFPVRAIFEAPSIREMGLLLDLSAGMQVEPFDSDSEHDEVELRGLL